MSLLSEAHLPIEARTVGLVRYLKSPRRSFWGWALFFGFIALNETRGVYVVAQFLKAYGGP